MRTLFSMLAVLMPVVATAASPGPPVPSVFERAGTPLPAGEIDRHVFTKLTKLGIQPVRCSDAVFVRRVYLDVIGKPPTAREARDFIDDKDMQSKRRRLIEQLLARDEFADYWSMKWGDTLRIKAEFPINLWPNAAQAYHRWVRSSIAENKPYDQFVREMLIASGSNFRVGQVNFYRALQDKTPTGITSAVALTFMGTRTDSWPKDRVTDMAVFFSEIGYKPTGEWKEEHVFWDPLRSVAVPGSTAPGRDAPGPKRSGKAAVEEPQSPRTFVTTRFPDGTSVRLHPDRDPREVFTNWLVNGKNPWFARSIANRVWAWLMGRGIVHEPDDIRPDNPPSNPELLAYLEKELVASRYDLKHLYRLILMSETYQLSSIPRDDRPDAARLEAARQFAHYPVRRLEAEVVIDAINAITGSADLYTSAIPEPFTYIPRDQSAVALADGSISSPFLAMFGRSARATGMSNERNDQPVPAQSLHMLNSSHIQRKLEQGPKLKTLLQSPRPPAEVIEELYLTILSRRPTKEEAATVNEYLRTARVKNEGALDIAWALINSPEFLYRH